MSGRSGVSRLSLHTYLSTSGKWSGAPRDWSPLGKECLMAGCGGVVAMSQPVGLLALSRSGLIEAPPKMATCLKCGQIHGMPTVEIQRRANDPSTPYIVRGQRVHPSERSAIALPRTPRNIR